MSKKKRKGVKPAEVITGKRFDGTKFDYAYSCFLSRFIGNKFKGQKFWYKSRRRKF